MVRVTPVLRLFFRAPTYLYRWHCGRLLGNRFLLLTHVGRRTGRRRETVLEVMKYRPGGSELVVMSAFGSRADWFLNIAAGPRPQVTIGPRRFVADYRILDQDEAAAMIAGYERRHRFIAPIVRTVLSRLLGWPYRGSEPDRHRLAAQMPFVAFRPWREGPKRL